MKIVDSRSGEERVKMAVEVMRCIWIELAKRGISENNFAAVKQGRNAGRRFSRHTVASLINLGLSPFSSSSPCLSFGVGKSSFSLDSTSPSAGCDGIVSLCVFNVNVVLNPGQPSVFRRALFKTYQQQTYRTDTATVNPSPQSSLSPHPWSEDPTVPPPTVPCCSPVRPSSSPL